MTPWDPVTRQLIANKDHEHCSVVMQIQVRITADQAVDVRYFQWWHPGGNYLDYREWICFFCLWWGGGVGERSSRSVYGRAKEHGDQRKDFEKSGARCSQPTVEEVFVLGVWYLHIRSPTASITLANCSSWATSLFFPYGAERLRWEIDTLQGTCPLRPCQ